MADFSREPKTSFPNAQELFCETCGAAFLFRGYEQETFAKRGWAVPKRCPVCRRAERERRAEAAELLERGKRQRERAEEQKLFEARLKDWKVVAKEDIRPDNDRVLYVIGNGFDLLHGVPSSYYGFRDFLGKHNELRFFLEQFLTVEDIWTDFENALAHFDIKAMCGEFSVDNWMDQFDAYEKDAGGSAFFMAAETAANPILSVANELHHRLRMWVESLSVETPDRPLRNIFRDGKVLCFNYTEFVETLYGVSEKNICYIHGCRRKKKGQPNQTLVLGHMPGASDGAYEFDEDGSVKTRDPYRRFMLKAAQEQALYYVTECDEMLTKNSGEIIAAHEAFFADLNQIEKIIVIGHSLAPVDEVYFTEIASRLSNFKGTQWFFGCYGLNDLRRLERMLAVLGLERSAVSVFRTDDIRVTTPKEKRAPRAAVNAAVEKTRCVSKDGRWAVKTAGYTLTVIHRDSRKTDFSVMFSSYVGDAFFVPSGEYLFAVLRGVDPGVFLFHIADGRWSFVNELKGIPNQGVVTPRLRRVFLTATKIVFVYHSRVRSYSLSDGALVSNRALRDAEKFSYEGEEITRLFIKKKYA